eukprot:302858-Amphidinium_carterae.1
MLISELICFSAAHSNFCSKQKATAYSSVCESSYLSPSNYEALAEAFLAEVRRRSSAAAPLPALLGEAQKKSTKSFVEVSELAIKQNMLEIIQFSGINSSRSSLVEWNRMSNRQGDNHAVAKVPVSK